MKKKRRIAPRKKTKKKLIQATTQVQVVQVLEKQIFQDRQGITKTLIEEEIRIEIRKQIHMAVSVEKRNKTVSLTQWRVKAST